MLILQCIITDLACMRLILLTARVIHHTNVLMDAKVKEGP